MSKDDIIFLFKINKNICTFKPFNNIANNFIFKYINIVLI